VSSKEVVKVFLLLLVGIIFVFSFSRVGATTFEHLFEQDLVVEPDTIIDSVDIPGPTSDEERVKNGKKTVVASTKIIISPEESKVFTKSLKNKNDWTISKFSQFSLLSNKNELSSLLTDHHLSLLSSAFYKAILATNFEIVERHTGLHPPENIELGFEAKIIQDEMDFIINNPNDTDYVVNIIITDHELMVELVGSPLLYRYDVMIEEKTSFPPKSIVQFDPKLPFGTSEVMEKGKDGYLLKIIRVKQDRNGKDLEREFISEDFYPPVHQVVSSSILSEDENKGVNDEQE
jgi:hypothetical protein